MVINKAGHRKLTLKEVKKVKVGETFWFWRKDVPQYVSLITIERYDQLALHFKSYGSEEESFAYWDTYGTSWCLYPEVSNKEKEEEGKTEMEWTEQAIDELLEEIEGDFDTTSNTMFPISRVLLTDIISCIRTLKAQKGVETNENSDSALTQKEYAKYVLSQMRGLISDRSTYSGDAIIGALYALVAGVEIKEISCVEESRRQLKK